MLFISNYLLFFSIAEHKFPKNRNQAFQFPAINLLPTSPERNAKRGNKNKNKEADKTHLSKTKTGKESCTNQALKVALFSGESKAEQKQYLIPLIATMEFNSSGFPKVKGHRKCHKGLREEAN